LNFPQTTKYKDEKDHAPPKEKTAIPDGTVANNKTVNKERHKIFICIFAAFF
jgi:hypothetical protein